MRMFEYYIKEAQWLLIDQDEDSDVILSIRRMCADDVGDPNRHPNSISAYCEAQKLTEIRLSLFDNGEEEPHLVLHVNDHKKIRVWLRSLTIHTLKELEQSRMICKVMND